MSRNGWLTVAVVGVATGLMVGCLKVNVAPGAFYAGEGGVHRVDPESLRSVMGKLRDLNKEIGEEVAERDWNDLADEAQQLADWANRASPLKRQATDETAFTNHCAGLSKAATQISDAALARDQAKANAGYNETTRLLGLIEQLVR